MTKSGHQFAWARPSAGPTAALVALCLATFPSPPAASAPARPSRATIHWDHVPLGAALARLSRTLDQPVFVDRRVDSSQPISLAARDATAAEILAQLAIAQSLGVSQLGPLLYVGPRDAATQLRTLAAVRRDEAAQLPHAQRAVLLEEQPLAWPRLTQPRTFVTDILRDRGWRVQRAELIPHDLWPTGGLPEFALADQLTVILASFDLTFQVGEGDNALELVPIERPVRLSRRYRWPDDSPPNVTLLRQQLPDGRVEFDGHSLHVDGRLEDHERLAQMFERPTARWTPARHPKQTKQIFTLRLKDQPVDAVLRQLGTQLGLQIDVDEEAIRAAGLSLEQRVSLAVEGVDLDELLDALLTPAGLTCEVEGQRLRVYPRDSGD